LPVDVDVVPSLQVVGVAAPSAAHAGKASATHIMGAAKVIR
jgi:hypothetical protein